MPRLTECLDAGGKVCSGEDRAGTPPGRRTFDGGRVASMLAASGTPFDGLILCGYPLHPAGNGEAPQGLPGRY